MAESEELETLVYCLGPVGGEQRVITQISDFSSKYDYTKKGYARYIEEATIIIQFQHLVIDYFMEIVKSEFEENPLAFIDAETEEDLMASIRKMKKPWKEMFKEHQKELREALKNPKEGQAIEDLSEDSSSSAKIRRIDPEAYSQASTLTLKSESEGTSGAVGVPVDEFEFPLSIFRRRLKEFHQSLKMEYRDLKARMGKALERFASKEVKVQDLKGFIFLNMPRFAKWKYALKTLGLLVIELEQKFDELDLDFYKKKENEKRLTDWMFFDDGRGDRKYHHRLLITMELAGPIEEVSGVVCKQVRRYRSLTQSLADKLPKDYEAFQEKVDEFHRKALGCKSTRALMRPQKSTDSDDTLFNIDDMPEET